MAAIDTIKAMSNGELIWYYEYCMVSCFRQLKNRGAIQNFHPSFNGNTIYVGNPRIFNLHYPNEMFLLNEMWERFISGTFLEQCWWMAKMPWKTNISYPAYLIRNTELATISTTRKKTKTETLRYNNETFTFIGAGLKRKAYLSPCKTYVIKVPREPYPALGIQENKREADTYKNNPNTIYAKCELIENDWLKMEYVKPAFFTKDDEGIPDWTYDIAEHQVGYNMEGKLVAYDYGSDR